MKIIFGSNFDSTPSFKASKLKKQHVKFFKETAYDIADKLIEAERKNLDTDKIVLSKLIMGFSIVDLAEKMGLPVYRINYISSKYDVHKIYMQRIEAVILDKLKNGKSRKTVAKEMDISKRTVQVVAEKYKVFQDSVKDRDRLILEKVKSGMQGKDVAKELGIHEATVWRTTQKYGISIKELKKQKI